MNRTYEYPPPVIYLHPHCRAEDGTCCVVHLDDITWCWDEAEAPCDECGMRPLRYVLAPGQPEFKPRDEERDDE